MRFRLSILVAAAAAVIFASCDKEPSTDIADRVTLLDGTSSTMIFEKTGGAATMKFVATKDWTISISGEWLSCSRMAGTKGTSQVSLNAEANETYSERTAEVTISAGSANQVISVKQYPKAQLYKVVAHRCGYLENGCAENSLTALKKTVAQYCYAAEVDVMWTKDNNVVVCHPDDSYKVNGLVPSESTLAEIREKGTLSDGSQMPCLEDFLDILVDKDVNPLGTKVWLDIKGPSTDTQKKVMDRCAEIAKTYKAGSLVEYLVPSGYADYTGMRASLMDNYGIDAAWNSKVDAPSAYGANGWAQMPYSTLRTSDYWPISKSYLNSGVRVSIYYTPSSKKYDSFYLDCLPIYNDVKALFVNHPQALIDELIKKGYER